MHGRERSVSITFQQRVMKDCLDAASDITALHSEFKVNEFSHLNYNYLYLFISFLFLASV